MIVNYCLLLPLHYMNLIIIKLLAIGYISLMKDKIVQHHLKQSSTQYIALKRG